MAHRANGSPVEIAGLVPEFAVFDPDASLGFYRDVRGFVVAYDRPEDRFAFLHLGGRLLMPCEIGVGRVPAVPGRGSIGPSAGA